MSSATMLDPTVPGVAESCVYPFTCRPQDLAFGVLSFCWYIPEFPAGSCWLSQVLRDLVLASRV